MDEDRHEQNGLCRKCVLYRNREFVDHVTMKSKFNWRRVTLLTICTLYPTIIRSICRFLESRTRCAKFRAGTWRMREPAIICRKPPRQVICAHRRGRLRSSEWRPV